VAHQEVQVQVVHQVLQEHQEVQVQVVHQVLQEQVALQEVQVQVH
jgi:hypothetical protein